MSYEYDFSDKKKYTCAMRHYDYILVGAGLYSAVIAWHAKQAGKSCLVLERRSHIGGNVYCEKERYLRCKDVFCKE